MKNTEPIQFNHKQRLMAHWHETIEALNQCVQQAGQLHLFTTICR